MPRKKTATRCGNCRIRKIKCDETKPECAKCQSFGLKCNAQPGTLDLMSVDTVVNLETSIHARSSEYSSAYTVENTLSSSWGLEVAFPLDFESQDGDLHLLGRFQSRTVFAVGPGRGCKAYSRGMINLASERPYLMHLMMAVTALHDRHLNMAPSRTARAIEACHLTRGIHLLNRRLLQPLSGADREAVWISAILVSCMASANLEVSNPELSWPLKLPDPNDLEWIRLSRGKTLFHPANWPRRPEPPVEPSISSEFYSNKHQELLQSLNVLVDSKSTSGRRNPYRGVWQGLSPLLLFDCDSTNIGHFNAVIGYMDESFLQLLVVKDPLALLLLSLWYVKTSEFQWWLSRRAALECQAICIYLEAYHSDKNEIIDLLWYSKLRCGLAGKQGGWTSSH